MSYFYFFYFLAADSIDKIKSPLTKRPSFNEAKPDFQKVKHPTNTTITKAQNARKTWFFECLNLAAASPFSRI
jgi:hypothetical protein